MKTMSRSFLESSICVATLALAGLLISAVPASAQGCDDDNCVATVCPTDPFCCNVAWDGICQGEAEALCTVCNCPTGDGAEWHVAPIGAWLPVDIGNAKDQNGDGLLCWRKPRGAAQSGDKGQDPIAWTWKDNSNQDNDSNCCVPPAP